jgi:hypothetical protein
MPSPVAAETLPRFSYLRAVCVRCGARCGSYGEGLEALIAAVDPASDDRG